MYIGGRSIHASNEEEYIGKEQQRSPNRYPANERFNQRLIQCIPNVILFLYLDYLILEFNPEAERLYGRKREDDLGKDYFEEFLPHDVREAIAADIGKVLAGEPTRGFENVVIARKGQERTLSWNVDRVLDSDDDPIGIIAVGQDITEREKTEGMLRKSEEKFRTLFESANDAIFALQVDGNNLYFKECNSHTENIFGCRKEDIIGKSPVDFSPSVQPDGTLSTERATELCAAAVGGEPQHFEWKYCYLTERIQQELGIECKFKSEGPPSSIDEDIKVVLFQSVRIIVTDHFSFGIAKDMPLLKALYACQV